MFSHDDVKDFESLRRALSEEREALLRQPLYSLLVSPDHVRRFMEQHVFAVFDFMSLLKALQRSLTGIEVPWVPQGDPAIRRFVNEIVLAEESDELPGLGPMSHFELYRAAMLEAGADVAAIDRFVARIRSGSPVEQALLHSDAPPSARSFVADTFSVVRSGSLPRIAGAFAIGREDVIPEMFLRIVRSLSERDAGRFDLFALYLERHVAVDSGQHGPLAGRMVEAICGDDPSAWLEAWSGARSALASRTRFWQEIARSLAGGAPSPAGASGAAGSSDPNDARFTFA